MAKGRLSAVDSDQYDKPNTRCISRTYTSESNEIQPVNSEDFNIIFSWRTGTNTLETVHKYLGIFGLI